MPFSPYLVSGFLVHKGPYFGLNLNREILKCLDILINLESLRSWTPISKRPDVNIYMDTELGLGHLYFSTLSKSSVIFFNYFYKY